MLQSGQNVKRHEKIPIKEAHTYQHLPIHAYMVFNKSKILRSLLLLVPFFVGRAEYMLFRQKQNPKEPPPPFFFCRKGRIHSIPTKHQGNPPQMQTDYLKK